MDKDKNVKSYSEFVNETEQCVVFNTNFQGMVQGAIGNIQAQVLAIAKMMADEKMARNPYRYSNADTTGGVEEVDISRAMNLIFHSEWKKHMKCRNVQEWTKTALEKAGKHDTRADKKNQRALRTQSGEQKDNYKVDLGSIENSRNSD